MAYPNLTSDPELVKIKIIDGQSKKIQNKTEKHDYDIISTSLESNNDYSSEI